MSVTARINRILAHLATGYDDRCITEGPTAGDETAGSLSGVLLAPIFTLLCNISCSHLSMLFLQHNLDCFWIRKATDNFLLL
jgi:hypothetical protein